MREQFLLTAKDKQRNIRPLKCRICFSFQSPALKDNQNTGLDFLENDELVRYFNTWNIVPLAIHFVS
jgi:hypothetical protein